jgi:hypothetical protein
MPRPRIPAPLRRLVLRRAGECCEYCLLHRRYAYFPHEVDHLIALQHGGPTESENLVYACFQCNRHKGSDLSAIDPIDRAIVLLFNPRAQIWSEHFSLAGAYLVGLTASGRATASLLHFNDEERVRRRQELMGVRLYPPEWVQ